MKPETKRLARRLAVAAGAGVIAYGAQGVPARQAMRLPVGLLTAAVLVNLTLTVKTASKAYATEARLSHFFNNGGSVGGNFKVNGNHSVTGTVSAGGTISNSSGNMNTNGNVNAPSGNVTGGTLTSNGDVQASSGTVHAGGVAVPSGTVSAATLTSSGDVQATSGTVHAAGLISSGSVQGASTTGDSTMGLLSLITDLDDGSATSNPPTQAQVEALRNRVNDILDYLKGGQGSSQNAIINRLNDLISALG